MNQFPDPGQAAVEGEAVGPMVYTVPECAALLRISENHAYNLIKQGSIPSLRFGKLIRVPQWALLQHLSSPASVANGADLSVHVTNENSEED